MDVLIKSSGYLSNHGNLEISSHSGIAQQQHSSNHSRNLNRCRVALSWLDGWRVALVVVQAHMRPSSILNAAFMNLVSELPIKKYACS